MKTLEIAYCLIKKNTRNKYHPSRFSPLLTDSRMPIYWNKKVAIREAERFNCEVIKVIVEPEDNLKKIII